ncbi:MAG: prevent-host-death protein [Rhizobacter sp.]|nr:prevent-host-death protein [Rhizobacter sp.]
MKSATLPSVRIEAALREEIERALNEGETLSTFVETSVRESLRRRLEQAEFVKRGLASLKAAQKSGHYVNAETAVRKLEDRLAKAKAAQARKAAAKG